MAKLHAVTLKKVRNIDMCFYNSHRWNFSRILRQMNKIIVDSCLGPCSSPIKYGTANDNYFKGTTITYGAPP